MMALNYKIRLYSVEDDVGRPELLSPFFCNSNDTYADLRMRLENGECVEWPFLFWDLDDACRIPKRFEAMNPVKERVYVILSVEGDAGRRKRCRVGDQSDTRSSDLAAEQPGQLTGLGGVQPCGTDVLHVGAARTLEEAGAAGLGHPTEVPEFPEDDEAEPQPTLSPTDVLEETLLQSTLLATDMLENYKQGAEKLRRELESLDFADHKWDLKTYDHCGLAVVKIYCGECKREIGGTGRDHSRIAVQNLFANFKKSHLHSALHIKQWCSKRGLVYSDHPKEGKSSKPIILTPADHWRLVEEGVSILQSVNDLISSNDPPFVIVGDVGVPQLKSFWFKVRCKLDGELLLLCPQKGNLRQNLENHVYGLVHTKCCEDLAAASSSSKSSCAVSSGKRGRPTARSRSTIGNQQDLHFWFNSSGSVGSEAAGESPLGMHSDSILSLLCWGFRKKIIEYAGKSYRVESLQNDSKIGSVWMAEPSTTADFVFRGQLVLIRGCFRHVQCKRLCATGEPFTNFICSNCMEIEQANDFRLRVQREGRALVKRGRRDIQQGRRIGYLQITELASQSRTLGRKYRDEKARHWLMKSRVAQLKVSQRGLKLSAVENFNRKDVLSFCNNILAAHRTNAFRGKPALWDFLNIFWVHAALYMSRTFPKPNHPIQFWAKIIVE